MITCSSEISGQCPQLEPINRSYFGQPFSMHWNSY